MATRVVVVIGAIVLLFVGAHAVVLQDEQTVRNAGDTTYTDSEPWQPTEGDVTHLNNSGRTEAVYDDQANVTVRQDSTTVPPDGNWTWHEHNGTVETLEGTSLNTSEEATISYAYHDPNEAQSSVRGLAELPAMAGPSIMVLLMFVLVVLVVAPFRGL